MVKLKARTWRLELNEAETMESDSFLAYSIRLAQLHIYSASAHLPSTGTTSSGLGLPTSAINKENAEHPFLQTSLIETCLN